VKLKMKEIEVYVERLSDDVILPKYAKDWDSGMDICSTIDIEFDAHETKVISTGLKVAIPNGYEIQVRPRSGMSLKTSFRVANAPGTVDSLYRDQIGVIMSNTSDFIQSIKKGDRIAQLVLQEVPRMKLVEIDDITKIEGNRNGGFGSTGV
jgi:dUTP pyrophosphatase